MKDGLFTSRDAQCEKCRLIYRLGDEHVCAVVTAPEEEKAEEGMEDPLTETPKKKRSKKE